VLRAAANAALSATCGVELIVSSKLVFPSREVHSWELLSQHRFVECYRSRSTEIASDRVRGRKTQLSSGPRCRVSRSRLLLVSLSGTTPAPVVRGIGLSALRQVASLPEADNVQSAGFLPAERPAGGSEPNLP
jgi:hypothetical protein